MWDFVDFGDGSERNLEVGWSFGPLSTAFVVGYLPVLDFSLDK